MEQLTIIQTKRFTTDFRPLSHIGIAELAEDHYWVTASDHSIPVSGMNTNHIKHVINCLNGHGGKRIPRNYLGKTKADWLKIFNNELLKRQ